MLCELLLRQLNELRLNRVLCDLELIATDQTSVFVHKIIMTAFNKSHFQHALKSAGTMKPITMSKMFLSVVSGEELIILVEFLYGAILNKQSKYDVLKSTLNKLNMTYLLDEAGEFDLENDYTVKIEEDTAASNLSVIEDSLNIKAYTVKGNSTSALGPNDLTDVNESVMNSAEEQETMPRERCILNHETGMFGINREFSQANHPDVKQESCAFNDSYTNDNCRTETNTCIQMTSIHQVLQTENTRLEHGIAFDSAHIKQEPDTFIGKSINSFVKENDCLPAEGYESEIEEGIHRSIVIENILPFPIKQESGIVDNNSHRVDSQKSNYECGIQSRNNEQSNTLNSFQTEQEPVIENCGSNSNRNYNESCTELKVVENQTLNEKISDENSLISEIVRDIKTEENQDNVSRNDLDICNKMETVSKISETKENDNEIIYNELSPHTTNDSSYKYILSEANSMNVLSKGGLDVVCDTSNSFASKQNSNVSPSKKLRSLLPRPYIFVLQPAVQVAEKNNQAGSICSETSIIPRNTITSSSLSLLSNSETSLSNSYVQTYASTFPCHQNLSSQWMNNASNSLSDKLTSTEYMLLTDNTLPITSSWSGKLVSSLQSAILPSKKLPVMHKSTETNKAGLSCKSFRSSVSSSAIESMIYATCNEKQNGIITSAPSSSKTINTVKLFKSWKEPIQREIKVSEQSYEIVHKQPTDNGIKAFSERTLIPKFSKSKYKRKDSISIEVMTVQSNSKENNSLEVMEVQNNSKENNSLEVMTVQNSSRENNSLKVMTVQNNSEENNSLEVMTVQNNNKENNSFEDITVQNDSKENNSLEDMAVQNTSKENNSLEDTAAENNGKKSNSLEDMDFQDNSKENNSFKDMTVENNSRENISLENMAEEGIENKTMFQVGTVNIVKKKPLFKKFKKVDKFLKRNQILSEITDRVVEEEVKDVSMPQFVKDDGTEITDTQEADVHVESAAAFHQIVSVPKVKAEKEGEFVNSDMTEETEFTDSSIEQGTHLNQSEKKIEKDKSIDTSEIKTKDVDIGRGIKGDFYKNNFYENELRTSVNCSGKQIETFEDEMDINDSPDMQLNDSDTPIKSASKSCIIPTVEILKLTPDDLKKFKRKSMACRKSNKTKHLKDKEIRIATLHVKDKEAKKTIQTMMPKVVLEKIRYNKIDVKNKVDIGCLASVQPKPCQITSVKILQEPIRITKGQKVKICSDNCVDNNIQEEESCEVVNLNLEGIQRKMSRKEIELENLKRKLEIRPCAVFAKRIDSENQCHQYNFEIEKEKELNDGSCTDSCNEVVKICIGPNNIQNLREIDLNVINDDHKQTASENLSRDLRIKNKIQNEKNTIEDKQEEQRKVPVLVVQKCNADSQNEQVKSLHNTADIVLPIEFDKTNTETELKEITDKTDSSRDKIEHIIEHELNLVDQNNGSSYTWTREESAVKEICVNGSIPKIPLNKFPDTENETFEVAVSNTSLFQNAVTITSVSENVSRTTTSLTDVAQITTSSRNVGHLIPPVKNTAKFNSTTLNAVRTQPVSKSMSCNATEFQNAERMITASQNESEMTSPLQDIVQMTTKIVEKLTTPSINPEAINSDSKTELGINATLQVTEEMTIKNVEKTIQYQKAGITTASTKVSGMTAPSENTGGVTESSKIKVNMIPPAQYGTSLTSPAQNALRMPRPIQNTLRMRTPILNTVNKATSNTSRNILPKIEVTMMRYPLSLQVVGPSNRLSLCPLDSPEVSNTYMYVTQNKSLSCSVKDECDTRKRKDSVSGDKRKRHKSVPENISFAGGKKMKHSGRRELLQVKRQIGLQKESKRKKTNESADQCGSKKRKIHKKSVKNVKKDENNENLEVETRDENVQFKIGLTDSDTDADVPLAKLKEKLSSKFEENLTEENESSFEERSTTFSQSFDIISVDNGSESEIILKNHSDRVVTNAELEECDIWNSEENSDILVTPEIMNNDQANNRNRDEKLDSDLKIGVEFSQNADGISEKRGEFYCNFTAVSDKKSDTNAKNIDLFEKSIFKLKLISENKHDNGRNEDSGLTESCSFKDVNQFGDCAKRSSSVEDNSLVNISESLKTEEDLNISDSLKTKINEELVYKKEKSVEVIDLTRYKYEKEGSDKLKTKTNEELAHNQEKSVEVIDLTRYEDEKEMISYGIPGVIQGSISKRQSLSNSTPELCKALNSPTIKSNLTKLIDKVKQCKKMEQKDACSEKKNISKVVAIDKEKRAQKQLLNQRRRSLNIKKLTSNKKPYAGKEESQMFLIKDRKKRISEKCDKEKFNKGNKDVSIPTSVVMGRQILPVSSMSPNALTFPTQNILPVHSMFQPTTHILSSQCISSDSSNAVTTLQHVTGSESVKFSNSSSTTSLFASPLMSSAVNFGGYCSPTFSYSIPTNRQPEMLVTPVASVSSIVNSGLSKSHVTMSSSLRKVLPKPNSSPLPLLSLPLMPVRRQSNLPVTKMSAISSNVSSPLKDSPSSDPVSAKKISAPALSSLLASPLTPCPRPTVLILKTPQI